VRHATVCKFFLTLVVVVLAACAEKPAPGLKPRSGSSLANAASIGTTVPTIVELSDMYVSPETYDLNVTVVEVIRGEKSGKYLKKLNASNLKSPADSEYVLARVRFEYKARGAPGDKPWELSGAQFSAYSGDNRPYGNPALEASQSGMKPSLRPGDTLECRLVFVVAKNDSKPVMVFNPGGAWFHLY
jgi:hypothetical protein